MIISHRHRFIFLKTQKTAGSSVELALTQICGPEDVITRMKSDAADRNAETRTAQNYMVPRAYRPRLTGALVALGARPHRVGGEYHQHMPARLVRRYMDPQLFDGYTKIAIVRNAWDREVSLYFWATRALGDRRPSFDRFVRRRVWRPDFKTFGIYSIGGRVVADRILRYETLAEDFAALVADLGVSPVPVLPRAKGGFRGADSRDYRSFYTPETVEVVRRRHAREIALFGMEF